MHPKIEKVAIYLRLSKEDLDKPMKNSTSESIKNQELLLKEEVAKHSNWQMIDIYTDEDFSGAGTYRPEFERMIKDCKEGKIDIVLCKSQSRFSRDMEVIEKYIHHLFPLWKVRFISLVDNADSENLGNKKARQINALINEWFLEDLSNNIKTTLRAKWQNGECTSSFPKYGLLKDPRNKNHLLIDPIASEILKQMANLFLKGYGPETIARIFNDKHIPSPYEYKKIQGSKLYLPHLRDQKQNSLTQKGDYIIHLSFANHYSEILKDIFLELTITNHGKEVPFPSPIMVRSLSKGITVYANNQKEFHNYSQLKENSHPLMMNDVTSNSITRIIVYLPSLDRLLNSFVEFEISLKDSKNNYKFQVTSVCHNHITLDYQLTIRKKCHWNGRVISRMLQDEAYHGILIQGKSKRISYKEHHCIPSPKVDWTIKTNAFEKIFDDETWKAIQSKFHHSSRVSKGGKKHIFEGKVYCAICGKIFHKNSTYTKKKEKIEYLLCSDKKTNWENCSNHKSIRLSELTDIIISHFYSLIQNYYQPHLFHQFEKQEEYKKKEEKLYTYEKEKRKINSYLSEKEHILKSIYEDKMHGLLEQEEFLTLKKLYRQEIYDYHKQLLAIEKKLQKINQTKREYDSSIFLSKKDCYLYKRELMAEMISKIEIGKNEENQREITITWNL